MISSKFEKTVSSSMAQSSTVIRVEEIGKVEQWHRETEIEWNIPDFFSVAKNKKFVNSHTFPFANLSWHLQLKLKSDAKPGFMCLFLGKVGNHECSVEYVFGLKKLDDSVEYLTKGIFKGIRLWTEQCYIKLSEVQQRKSELVPSGALKITCKLQSGATDTGQPKILDIPKPKKLIQLDTLSENFKSLFLSKENCDTTLLVMDNEFRVHRTVLMARSPVFAAMFLHETSEKKTGIVTIPDCDPESFGEFLEFLYTGKFEEPSFRSALSLYETSDKYDVKELQTFCTEYLMENFTAENLCDVMIMADKYDDVKLLSAAQCFFNKNLGKVLVTSEWECLLKTNYRLANKLMIDMSSKVKIVD